MKTIVHIELSDSDRNDLARRVDRDPVTKRLVTRKEVTDLVNALVQDEITQGWESTTTDRGGKQDGDELQEHTTADEVRGKAGQGSQSGDDSAAPAWKPPSASNGQIFIPSRGDEDYLTQPKDTGIAAACSRILDDTALINAFAWNTIERNRK